MPETQTTVRLSASVKSSIDAFKQVEKTTLNRLINDALKDYIERQLSQKIDTLQASLATLRAYNERDPDYHDAIRATAAAEAEATYDPAEGALISEDETKKGDTQLGPMQKTILGILDA